MFSSASHLMGKRLMPNLHSSLDTIYKIRISTFGMWGGFTDITCININFFYLFYCQELCYITPKIDTTTHSSKLKTEMTAHNSHTHNALQCNTRCQVGVPFHNFLPYTQKCILKFFQSWGGSIPQLFILNWEMKDSHWYLLLGVLQY